MNRRRETATYSSAEENSYSEDQTEESSSESEHSSQSEGSSESESSKSLIITDPKVLDCSICFQVLTVPVYQCNNGHTICSTCCENIGDECPTCASLSGYSRCKAIEKVLESVKVSCRNTKYGCREALSYNSKKKHEKSCPFVRCSFPIDYCNFKGSSENLRRHISNEHEEYVESFDYNRHRSVSLTLGVREELAFIYSQQQG